MKNRNITKTYIVSGAKTMLHLAKWFVIGYGLASISIDIRDMRKAE